jgi:CDP-4-dehydro-6-deoxyglucose reductase
MTEFLTVSRASRLVGVTRTTLQQKIQTGELETFDGKISASQLLCLYPNACFEKNSFMMERVEQIKAQAIHTQHEPCAAATVETLTAQLEKRARELHTMQELIDCCQKFYQQLVQRVQGLDQLDELQLRSKIKELQQWLIVQSPKSMTKSHTPKTD